MGCSLYYLHGLCYIRGWGESNANRGEVSYLWCDRNDLFKVVRVGDKVATVVGGG